MKHMTLSEIADACCGIYCGDPAFLDCEVSSVAIDSRKVIKDTLFVAIKGARVDGHSFIPQVMEAGALCSLSEQDLGDVDYPYIRVSSCTEALKDLAEHYRRSLDIKVVGITGSVGKTSTKEMIASVLSEKYNVLKTEGNFNNEIGLPLTVFNIREEHEVAVLEMGISHFGDMKPLAKIARPDVCVITNIGYAHLENLGTRDGILKEKSSMTDYMNPKGSVIFNGDDDKLKSYTSRDGRTPVYFGLTSSCPFHVENIERKGLKGTYAEFVTPTSRFHAHISIPGDHMIDPTHFHFTPVHVEADNDFILFSHICHLLEDTDGRISRSELEQILNYSGNYLNTIVKKYTHKCLFDYGQTFCMKKAATLLKETTSSISEIMEELHFTNTTHFYKCFKEHYHMTPNQFRISSKNKH